ncbi:MAG TPA: tRNA (adenosine(37)-N6)-threonylcarbamoyltransferase complex dimerization subunit type 1 TsaB [Steroidobacteraceae bacterium]|nr:tRNA (adenosine(37)-N6)-threonylcarbamoyltransferase complex dimerization subunit type 1 TsaB [Steroidobacteraceae bacterium]
MRVLALDTATQACSVALLDGGRLIGRHEEVSKSHAQRILGMIDSVLAEAALPLSLLDGIAASVGPGSFTGVRISVAVAQGLAFGAGLRVVPVTTLEALAFGAVRNGARQVLACLDARMGEVYWGCFRADADRGVIAVGPVRVGPPGSVALPLTPALPALGVYCGMGRGFTAYPVLGALPGLELDPTDALALPDAREFAALGALRLKLGGGIDAADLCPLYVRDKVALTEAERGRPQP